MYCTVLTIEPQVWAEQGREEQKAIAMRIDERDEAENADIDEERLVLSEVHVGEQQDDDDNAECDQQACGAAITTTTATKDLLVSRYRYHTPLPPASAAPAARATRVDRSSSSSKHEIDAGITNDSSSEGETLDDDGCSVVARRRRRSHKRPRISTKQPPHLQVHQTTSTPRYEVLTIVHRMATPLDLVGQQVWSAAFLLGDFVLTHEEWFAGAQVGSAGDR